VDEGTMSLNVAQAATLLGLRPASIRKACYARSLPHYKLGTRTVFDRDELLAWRAARRVAPLCEERRRSLVSAGSEAPA
jgi:excisionase family DNA binding protein